MAENAASRKSWVPNWQEKFPCQEVHATLVKKKKIWVPTRDVRIKKIFSCWIVYETQFSQNFTFFTVHRNFFLLRRLGSVSQMSLMFHTILEPDGLELAILGLLACCLIH